ncbi:MAG: hypothetical protein BWK73_53145 [Thiothrix lacustris]|uniref:Uncharacterized protein n=1 Tax=Thiothrix lacustris TaxID=525917 RepID=A0A1Y1Q7B7_9GAMM|nr:MAG: hypothetical protein BWK73_53145 [Thiothrix lacustris]
MPDSLIEGSLHFIFPNAQKLRKFDDPIQHGLTHAGLQAVDFLVEWEDTLWLVEVKDPESAADEKRERSIQGFRRDMERNKLIFDHLSPKLRDSLFYLWLNDELPAKPLHYLVLIGLESLLPPRATKAQGNFYQRNLVVWPYATGLEKTVGFTS